MQLSVEISLYPLKDEFIPTIQAFIDRVNQHADLEVITNTMSTQIFGNYDVVMNTLREEIRISFENHGKSIFVCKFIHGNLSPSA